METGIEEINADGKNKKKEVGWERKNKREDKFQ